MPDFTAFLIGLAVVLFAGQAISFRRSYGHWPWVSCDICKDDR